MDRSTWVEVSSEALRANLEAVRNKAQVPVCAVVKANAYGHGLVGTARILSKAGASMLGVTRIEEARALRSAGIATPILILMPVSDPREAGALDCDITVGATEQILDLPGTARVHLKVDVGMGRLGVEPAEAFAAAGAIRARASLQAVWTHLPDAGGSEGRLHLERFRTVVTALRHDGMAVAAHAANSAALCALDDATFDMVRVGTILYGQHPAGAKAPFPLQDTFSWYARVDTLRTVPAGATVGYGSEWQAKEPTRIATLPIGYADGFGVEPAARTPSPVEAAKGIARIAARTVRRTDRAVYFGDQRAPVIGRVAMQAITVSLQDARAVEEGSVARIPARRLMVNPMIERVYT